ncbi:MAG: VWA domain-containing protein [Acidobacteriota bacterium]|nr:VWA domain-containing protein [Acidobacteriota bacterium]
MKKSIFALILCWLTAIPIFAQQPVSRPTPPPPPQQQQPVDEDDVVKITTELVQLDAIVTDDKGNHVTTLTADDFEILQDGKPQKITNLSYVRTVAPEDAVPLQTDTKRIAKNVIAPPVKGRLPENGRLLTFIVDNCNTSGTSMYAIREGLIKFVEKQMLPNDVVAIYQTRGGASLVQQFTNDKEQLLRIIRKVNWIPGGGCNNNIDLFEPARSTEVYKGLGRGSVDFETPQIRAARQAAEDAHRAAQTVGILGIMNYVVRGLERVPGRKVVFLLSDGLPIFTQSGDTTRAEAILRDLTDMANRASVVFNTITAYGVNSTDIVGAVDEVVPDIGDAANPLGVDKLTSSRRNVLMSGEDGLRVLARETGGRFYKNSNFLDVPVRRALNLEKGYYLLAYEPDEETFKGKKFNKIEIRVKRPELRISSRAGFISRTDQETKPKPYTGDQALYEAIRAPLPESGLSLQLTAFFKGAPDGKNFVRSMLHINGDDITFVDQPNGDKRATFDIVAVTLNEKNEVIDDFNRTHSVTVPASAIPVIKQNGLIYSVDVPVKKDGTYYYRVAVRDAVSNILGSASQVIQVPNLKKDRIFMSGLMLSLIDSSGKFDVPSIIDVNKPISAAVTPAVPAIRQFRRGMFLAYSYTLYSPAIDKASGKPNLTVQVRLYRDGKVVTESPAQPAQLNAQSDWSRVNDYGYLRLKPNMEAGDYILQVIVRDTLTNQATSQWIDFQVTQ